MASHWGVPRNILRIYTQTHTYTHTERHGVFSCFLLNIGAFLALLRCGSRQQLSNLLPVSAIHIRVFNAIDICQYFYTIRSVSRRSYSSRLVRHDFVFDCDLIFAKRLRFPNGMTKSYFFIFCCNGFQMNKCLKVPE